MEKEVNASEVITYEPYGGGVVLKGLLGKAFFWLDVLHGLASFVFLGFLLWFVFIGPESDTASDSKSNPTPVFCLKPGQSAYLLEDVTVDARIPYQDKELYTGKVKLEKAAFLMKPVIE